MTLDPRAPGLEKGLRVKRAVNVCDETPPAPFTGHRSLGTATDDNVSFAATKQRNNRTHTRGGATHPERPHTRVRPCWDNLARVQAHLHEKRTKHIFTWRRPLKPRERVVFRPFHGVVVSVFFLKSRPGRVFQPSLVDVLMDLQHSLFRHRAFCGNVLGTQRIVSWTVL